MVDVTIQRCGQENETWEGVHKGLNPNIASYNTREGVTCGQRCFAVDELRRKGGPSAIAGSHPPDGPYSHLSLQDPYSTGISALIDHATRIGKKSIAFLRTVINRLGGLKEFAHGETIRREQRPGAERKTERGGRLSGPSFIVKGSLRADARAPAKSCGASRSIFGGRVARASSSCVSMLWGSLFIRAEGSF